MNESNAGEFKARQALREILAVIAPYGSRTAADNLITKIAKRGLRKRRSDDAKLSIGKTVR